MNSFLRLIVLPLTLAAVGLFEVTPPNPDDNPNPPEPPKPPEGVTKEVLDYITSQIDAAKAAAKADFDAQAEAARVAAEKAEADRKAKESGDFETLESGYKSQIAELTPFKERAASLEARLLEQYTADSAEIPETLRAFQPKDDATLEAKLDWLATAKEQAAKMTPTPGRPGLRGDPTKPIPIDKVREDAARQDARSNVRRSI